MKSVSPLGLGSAIMMVQYFINRAGRRLKPTMRYELEMSKMILQKMRLDREFNRSSEDWLPSKRSDQTLASFYR